MAQAKNTARLVTDERRGLLEVTIWANPTDLGQRHNVTLKRSYKQGEEWRETKISLPLTDLLQAARLLEWASDRVFEDIERQKFLKEQHGDDGDNEFVSQAGRRFHGTVVVDGDEIPF